jgi:hypothetical protein
MRRIITISLVNGIIFGTLISLFYTCLSSTYLVASPILGKQEVLTGLDAVNYLITEFGVWSFVEGVLGLSVVLSSGVFVSNVTACTLLQKKTKKQN